MKQKTVMLFLMVTFLMNFSLAAQEGFADGEVESSTTDQSVQPITDEESSPSVELMEDSEESASLPVADDSSFD